MLVFRAVNFFFGRIAKREDPDQTASIRLLLQKQSDLGLPCLFRPFRQAISVQNFRPFTVTSFGVGKDLLFCSCSRYGGWRQGAVDVTTDTKSI